MKTLADRKEYKSYVIEDNIDERFSALSPVGLLPIATAGFDVDRLIEGARQMEAATDSSVDFEQNMAMQYMLRQKTSKSQV